MLHYCTYMDCAGQMMLMGLVVEDFGFSLKAGECSLGLNSYGVWCRALQSRGHAWIDCLRFP